jgi:predicted RNA-binding protein with PUA-like domain
VLVDVQALRKTRTIGLAELRGIPPLAGMGVLQKGSRLSITPVSPQEWETIVALADHG